MSTISTIRLAYVGLEPNPIGVNESFLVQAAFRVVDVGEYTIPVTAWKGTGPYYADVSIPLADREELIAYVADFATLEQRAAEYNAIIQAKEGGTGVMRFWATSLKPTVDIPIQVISGMFSNVDVVDIPESSWQGSGPWICSVDLGHEVRTATCAMPDGLTKEQAEAYIESGIHVSGVSGNSVTLRAMLDRPNMDVRVGILSE